MNARAGVSKNGCAISICARGLRRDRERLNDLSARMAAADAPRTHRRRQRFETLTAKLGQLDPRLVLARGYAIVLNERDGIVRETADAPVGEK